MLQVSRNKCLPCEILEQVFQNLIEKEDHKECSLVCKYWRYVAQEYFRHEISIKVNESRLGALQGDIKYFGKKVKAIEVKMCKYLCLDANNEPSWRSVLSSCPYLTSVKFLNYCHIFSFIKSLNDPNISLDNLEKIEAEILVPEFLGLRDIFLQVNIHHCQTIKSLKLCDSLGGLISEKYGGLDKLVSQFPRLKFLEAHGRYWIPSEYENLESTVDIEHLLEGVPQLEIVELKHFHQITSNHNTSIAPIKENTSLTTLTIIAKNISVQTLQYIIETLKQVKNFRLFVNNVISDHERELQTILNDLRVYTSGMETYCVEYEYGDGNRTIYYKIK